MFSGIVIILIAWFVKMPLWLSILTTICGAGEILLDIFTDIIKSIIKKED